MIEEKIKNSFLGKNCLVTGGTGLIGREVVNVLCDFGAEVKVVSLDNIIIDNRAKHLKVDLTDLNICKEVTAGMDYVFHLAV